MILVDKDGSVEIIQGPPLDLELSPEDARRLVLDEVARSGLTLAFTFDSYDWDHIKMLTCDALGIDGYDDLIGNVSLADQFRAVWNALSDLLETGQLVVAEFCDDGMEIDGRPMWWAIRIASSETTDKQRALTAALVDGKPIANLDGWTAA